MPRTAEFDRDRAVDAAMRLFWVRGFGATSMTQLLEAMQIGRGSFYAAFASKEALFAECLQLFAGRTRHIVTAARQSGKPLQAIAQFFDATTVQAPAHRVARGCMMVNSVLELADVSPQLSRRAADCLAQIEAEFAACFRAAQASGDYPADRDPADLAATVMLINQGVRVASRTGVEPAALKKTVTTALALLDIAA